jgi:hypothetical protein
MPSICIVTTTGNRPLTFSLLERYVSRQTRQPDAWFIVDDGDVPTVPTIGQTVIRRQRLPVEPEHTLPLQWLAVLPALMDYDFCLVAEDDDWYSPAWLETMTGWLDTHDLVGEGWAKYFHVRNGWFKSHQNSAHCSLAATGFRTSELAFLIDDCCRRSIGPCIDSRMWDVFQGRKRVYPWGGHVVQLKGGPGRRGTLPSHYDDRHYVADTDDATLKAYVGEDYADIVRVYRTENVG